MPRAETPLGALFYAETGQDETSKPPLLLIHGAGSSHLAWDKAFRRIDGRRVIALDLPGHGRSTGESLTAVKVYAESAAAFLDALSIEKAVIVGHSMGGAVAQTLALDHAERVAKLVLIATGAKLPVNPDVLKTVMTDKQRVAEWVNEWAWAPDAPEDLKQAALDYMVQVPAEVLRDDYLACDNFNRMADVKHISAPTLIMGGTADKMTPHRWSVYLNEHIPDSELYTVQGAGHWIILEQPQTLSDKLKVWLDE